MIYEGQYYTYSYSFEPDYAKSKGKEFNCNLNNLSGSSAEEFMTKYIASAKAIPNLWNVVAERRVNGDVIYRMFDGRKVEFPSNMALEEVEGILRKQLFPNSQLKPKKNIFGDTPVETTKKSKNERGMFIQIPVGDSGPWSKYARKQTDREKAEFIIQKYQIKYKRRYDLNKLLSGLGIVLLIAISWYFFSLVLYKIILYIVHGHTIVRKPTPNP